VSCTQIIFLWLFLFLFFEQSNAKIGIVFPAVLVLESKDALSSQFFDIFLVDHEETKWQMRYRSVSNEKLDSTWSEASSCCLSMLGSLLGLGSMKG
jgi:hypothetical protein